MQTINEEFGLNDNTAINYDKMLQKEEKHTMLDIDKYSGSAIVVFYKTTGQALAVCPMFSKSVLKKIYASICEKFPDFNKEASYFKIVEQPYAEFMDLVIISDSLKDLYNPKYKNID